MTEIRRSFSGAPWEPSVGYCRAIRAGKLVYTAGTMAVDEQGVIHGADSYEQCCYIFEKLARALADLGASLEHVVKTTSFITDIAEAEGFGRAHKQYLGAASPAATCVVVKELFDPAARVEIELVAILPE